MSGEEKIKNRHEKYLKISSTLTGTFNFNNINAIDKVLKYFISLLIISLFFVNYMGTIYFSDFTDTDSELEMEIIKKLKLQISKTRLL